MEEDHPWYGAHRDNIRRFHALFDDPGHAAGVLREATVRHDVPASVSSILLDNATIDHAMRYFDDARCESPILGLSARPRLMLLAVAEFVNATILYEDVMTGPGVWPATWGDPLLRDAARIVGTVNQRLSWAEIFAVLALAKAAAMESACEQGSIGLVGSLLKVRLENGLVLRHLSQVNSGWSMSPHRLASIVHDDDYYLRDFASSALWHSRTASNAVNRDDGKGYWYSHESPPFSASHTERFAAHLIYRTHVYLLLADLLGCPYSADALRSELVQRSGLVQPRPPRGFAERATTLVGVAEYARDGQVNELLGYEAFQVRIPLVLKYVLSRASRPSEILEITLETRSSKPARRFREHCAHVDAAIAGGKRDDVARAFAELSSYGVRMEKDLSERQTTASEVTGTVKELISIKSPLAAALVTAAARQASRWLRHRKFAFVEHLARTPRNLNEVEREFARLWPHL